MWLSHAFVVTLRCKASYMNHLFDFPGKMLGLHIPLLTIYGQYERELNARTLHTRVLSDTKESLTFLKAKIVYHNEINVSPDFS